MHSRFRLWGLGLVCLWITGAASAQTELVVSPTELTLATTPGGKTSSPVSVITTVTDAPFVAEIRYLGLTGGWLSIVNDSGVRFPPCSVPPAPVFCEITPTSINGRTPVALRLAADAAGLAAGNYVAQLTVRAGNLGKVVNVRLAVGNAGTLGSVSVTPSTVTLVGQPGQATATSQNITVSTTSTSPITFHVTSSAPEWLVVSPFPVTVSAGNSATVLVEAYLVRLPAGTFSATLTFSPSSGGNPTVVPVTLVSQGGAGADAIRLNRTGLTIRHQLNESDPAFPVDIVGVFTNEFRNYTATAISSPPWLRLNQQTNTDPITDISPGFFYVYVQPPPARTEPYSGRVEISAAGLPTVTLPVTLTVTNSPEANATPSSIVLDDTITGTLQEDLRISMTDDSVHAFAAQAESVGGWLSVAPTTGSTFFTEDTVVVSANTATLEPGTYDGRVRVTVTNGSQFTVPVRLNVTGVDQTSEIMWQTVVVAEDGTLTRVPEVIELAAVVGGANPSQTVDLRTDQGPPHDFTVAARSPGGWLRVEPFNGKTPARLTIAANLAALPRPGAYQGSVRVTSLLNLQTYDIPVTLNYGEATISAEPTSLLFKQERKGAALEPQALAISGNVPMAFRVAEVPIGIRLSASSGTTPANLTVWAEASMLPPGSNQVGVIKINGPRNQVSIPVGVSLVQDPVPSVSPESVSLSYTISAPGPTQTVSVQTAEPGTFTVSVTTETGAKWLSATPVSGSTPGTFALAITPDALVTGRNSGTVTVNISVSGTSYVRTIPVVVTAGRPDNTIHSILHSASLLPSTVAPGLMITVRGSGLGPATGVSARPSAAGAFPTDLSDVRLSFDGTPAPLLYVSTDQINAIAPYSLAGRISTRVRVEKGANWSLPIDLRVVEAAPGIFTVSGTGRGQVSAVNADLSANSTANPAPKGSVITVFGTGEGQTDPGGQDGRVIATDIRRPVLPVTAKVNGKEAEVVYAGSAPAQVSGMFQVNLRIPEDTPSGVVPIEIQVGSATSQPGLTIVVE
jgi:uncharacterized protein (TIGR03437 family)